MVELNIQLMLYNLSSAEEIRTENSHLYILLSTLDITVLFE